MRRNLVAVQEMYVRVGAAIRAAREAEQLSRRELALKCNVSTTHLENVESGDTQCSLHLLVAIADELDLSCDELVPVAIEARELESA